MNEKIRELSRDSREEEVQFIDATLADQDEEKIRERKEFGDIGGRRSERRRLEKFVKESHAAVYKV